MIAFLLLSIVLLLLPSGLSYPADENMMGENGALMDGSFPPPKPPKGCFHFYVSRNMSSLLSDATKMLPQVRDRREREWILTFIYRIKSLAEHLRAHPSSRNYDCIVDSDPHRDALYFVDDLPPQKRSGDNQQQPPRSQPEESPGTVQSGTHQGYLQYRRDQSHQDNPQSDSQKDLSHQEQQVEPHQDLVQSNSQKDAAQSGHQDLLRSINQKGTAQSYQELTEAHQDIPQSNNQKDTAQSGQTDSHQDFLQSTNQKGASQSHQELTEANQEFTQSTNQKDTAQSGPQTEEAHQEFTQSTNQKAPQGTVQSGGGGPTDHVIVISSSPDCEENAECEEALSRQAAARGGAGHSDDLLVQELHSKHQEKNHQEEDRMQQLVLKERIRKALLQEMASEVKKLRTVGGSEEDLLNLWKQSESDTVKPSENYYEFDYEETGTAAGDLNDANDSSTPHEHTVAPSLGDIRSRQSNNIKGGTQAYEPYDDSDVLVKQLFDVRFEQSKSTKSIDNSNKEEYLITSTHVPY